MYRLGSALCSGTDIIKTENNYAENNYYYFISVQFFVFPGL